jgi:hypothetical protein
MLNSRLVPDISSPTWYTVVTLLLHCCHTFVTLLLHIGRWRICGAVCCVLERSTDGFLIYVMLGGSNLASDGDQISKVYCFS